MGRARRPAGGSGVPTQPVEDDPRFARLALNTPVRGSLAARRVSPYVADGADAITLTSLRGDADLYVFSAPSLDESTLVCSSTEAHRQLQPRPSASCPPATPTTSACSATPTPTTEIVATGLDIPAQPPANDGGGDGGSVPESFGGAMGGRGGRHVGRRCPRLGLAAVRRRRLRRPPLARDSTERTVAATMGKAHRRRHHGRERPARSDSERTHEPRRRPRGREPA